MKTFIARRTGAFLIAAFLALAAPAAESLSVLLQKGIYAEETEGNLESAIKIYEQIGTEAAANQSVATQALFRLAVCYEKLRKKEQAVRLLNELLRQFPSDVALNEKARATLAGLGAKPVEAVSVRNVQIPVATTRIMSVSQDGRFAVYVPTATTESQNDIAICELGTGKTWTVTKGTKDYSLWYEAKISPDGQWLAWQISRDSDEAIFIARVDGSESRKFYEFDNKKEGGMMEGWSSDSKHLMVESWNPGMSPPGWLLLALDAKTGAKKEIARASKVDRSTVGYTYTYALLTELGFVWGDYCSADGRFLAAHVGQYPRRISVWDLKSGHEETIVDANAGYCFGWFGGGTKVLYSKKHAGSMDLWAVGIKDGKPSDEPELIWSNLGDVRPLGITRDGNVFGTSRGSGILWMMQGLQTKNSTPTQTSSTGANIPPDEIFSPNRSVLDRKSGLSATYPKTWEVRSATRGSAGGTVIGFQAGGIQVAFPALFYHSTQPWGDMERFMKFTGAGPKPKTSDEIGSWLRKAAGAFEQQRITLPLFADYRIHPASFVERTVGGHRALSWSADFGRSNSGKLVKWAEYLTIVYSEDLIAMLYCSTQETNVDAVRPALDEMLATIRFP